MQTKKVFERNENEVNFYFKQWVADSLSPLGLKGENNHLMTEYSYWKQLFENTKTIKMWKYNQKWINIWSIKKER